MQAPDIQRKANIAISNYDIDSIRADFPILSERVHDHPLVYLDNGATAQKPKAVIDRIQAYYEAENSNIHRGVHFLSQQATDRYEAARERVRQFINAAHAHEVIFTRGTTESINLVASAYGRQQIQAGDEVLISTMEHHSNIVPWQLLCEEKGATLKSHPYYAVRRHRLRCLRGNAERTDAQSWPSATFRIRSAQ